MNKSGVVVGVGPGVIILTENNQLTRENTVALCEAKPRAVSKQRRRDGETDAPSFSPPKLEQGPPRVFFPKNWNGKEDARRRIKLQGGTRQEGQ